MIMEKESEIKVLRFLCGRPFDYFSVAETSTKTGISRNWIYRIMDKFWKSGILEKSGKRFKLDFTSPFCRRLKLLFDSEYLLSMDPEMMARVSSVSGRIAFEMKPESIVLVGSSASGKHRKGSDLDFLVVGDSRKIPHSENCNIVSLTLQEAREKYMKGDDFIISSILFGRIIYDREVFTRFLESPLPIFSQEIIQEKIMYCETLAERIYSLLKSDERQAGKELLYLALQSARIVLLRKRIVPGTKYDIASQVMPFSRELARIIEELLEDRHMGKEKIIARMRACMEAAG